MRSPGEFSFENPLKIICGSHALDHLPMELIARDARSPLILASRDPLGRKHARAVVDAFRPSGLTVGIYDQLSDRIEADLIPFLQRMYRDGACDGIIAVGNGTVVDTAKRLNLAIVTEDHGAWHGADQRVVDPAPLRPFLLAATPGGDGDEVSGYGWDGDRRLRSHRLIPAVACIDPVLMNGDERKTVDGALIGLVHAVEAFLDVSAGPLCRAYAQSAIGQIMHYLPRALRNSERRKSLATVVNGQVAAGCARFAALPGICHYLAALFRESTEFSMGHLMAMFLPHVLSETGTLQPEQVGDLLMPIAGADTAAMTAAELKTPRVIALFWEFFDALNGELTARIPSSLSDAGMADEQISHALNRLGDGGFGDRAVRIIELARQGVTLVGD